MKLKDTPWKESYDPPRQHIKNQRPYFANKGPSGEAYGFFSGHVWMWELDCEESWVLKNLHFWTMVLEKTLESLLDCKEIQPVHPKGDQSCVFIGRTDAEAETPVLWPPHKKSWLVGKDHSPPPPKSSILYHFLPLFPLTSGYHCFFFLLFLTFFILLLFLECHVVGIIPYVAFLYWLLSLNNIQLILSSVFSWLDSSFLFSAE